MNDDKTNYKILKAYDLDLIYNIVQNKIDENIGYEFIYNEDFDIYTLLNKVLENLLIKFNRILIISSNVEELYKHNKTINSLKENLYDVSKEYSIEEKLKNQISLLPNNTGKTLLSKVEVLSRRIDNNIDLLNNIVSFFYNKDDKGLSLVDKYYITEKFINNKEKTYYYYKIFRIKKPFENLTYFNIKDIKEEILKKNLIPTYIKYRRYLDNSRFMILKNSISNTLLEETINKLTNINKVNGINLTCMNLKYKGDFIDNFTINQSMSLYEVNELADIINTKYNGYLLEQKSNRSLLSFFKKDKKNSNKENIEKYNNLKEEILKDFNKLYTNITSEINRWGFLSQILIEEEFMKFKIMIINGEDIKEKSKFYLNILKISKNIETIKTNIENLDDNIKEVLDYCYDSIEYKNDLENIVKNIDNLKLFYEIENMEVKNEGIIRSYKNFDDIKERIRIDIETRNNLIEEGLKLLWDNLIRETYKISNVNIDKVDYFNKETFKNVTPIVLSDANSIFDNKIFFNLNSFDKVIVLDTNKDIDRVIKSVKKDKLIVFKNTNTNQVETIEEITKIDLSNINEICIKENHINYSFLDYVVNYLSNKGYIVTKNPSFKKDTYKLIISNLNNDKKIGLIIDTETFNCKNNHYIKELYSRNLEEEMKKEFFVYRIWSRDIWIDKNKVLTELLSYVKEVLE